MRCRLLISPLILAAALPAFAQPAPVDMAKRAKELQGLK